MKQGLHVTDAKDRLIAELKEELRLEKARNAELRRVNQNSVLDTNYEQQQRLLAYNLGKNEATEQALWHIHNELYPYISRISKANVLFTFYYSDIRRVALLKLKGSIKREVYLELLRQISPDLAAATVQLANVTAETDRLEKELGLPPRPSTGSLELASAIQDAIQAVLRGDDNGDGLAKLFVEHPVNIPFVEFLDTIPDASKRARGITPERAYVGCRAAELQRLPSFKGKGWAQRAGLEIIAEIERLPEAQRSAEQKAALYWLILYKDDLRRLGQEISEARSAVKAAIVTT